MSASGTIITRVYTSQAQIPIQGATVAFTQKTSEGRHTLLAVRVTDETGRTSPVSVETPALSIGTSPNAAVPFALCDLWVQSPGFEMLLTEDVQIFPNVQTILDVMLIPLSEQASPSTRGEFVQITPQGL